jgi:hypothetical protein
MTKESSAETMRSSMTPSLPAKTRDKRSFRAQTTSGTLHRRSRRRQFAHAHGTIRSHGLSFSISGSQRFGFSILPHLAHPPPRNRPAIPRRQRKPPPRLRPVHPAAKSQRVACQHFSVSVFSVLKRAPADEPQIVRRGRGTITLSGGQKSPSRDASRAPMPKNSTSNRTSISARLRAASLRSRYTQAPVTLFWAREFRALSHQKTG